MDKEAHKMELGPVSGSRNATSSITFDSVINLSDCASKKCKVNIDQSVVERPGQGNGAEFVSVKENAAMTENGKLVAEHVLNDLTLTEHGRSVHLSDHTYITAAKPEMHERKKIAHCFGGDHAKREIGKDKDKAVEEAVPKLDGHDHSKR